MDALMGGHTLVNLHRYVGLNMVRSDADGYDWLYAQGESLLLLGFLCKLLYKITKLDIIYY